MATTVATMFTAVRTPDSPVSTMAINQRSRRCPASG
jgi:hypothetical protein